MHVGKILMNLPDELMVGFQKRDDTYGGMLAYVTYTKKGKIAKEVSWDGWRDKSIDPVKCVNEPTSGFILNKKVGDYHGSWYNYGRYAYCRVYDPRGWEFEISIDNLLMILYYCDCVNKILSGEFVYAWVGQDLWLLPTESKEYKDSKKDKESVNAATKVTAKNLEIGSVYVDKNNEKIVYLGKLKFVNIDRSMDYDYDSNDENNYEYIFSELMYHTFYCINNKGEYYDKFRGYNSISGLIKYQVEGKKLDISKYMEEYNTKHNFNISDLRLDVKLNKKESSIPEGDKSFKYLYRVISPNVIQEWWITVERLLDGKTRDQINREAEAARYKLIRPSEKSKIIKRANQFDKLAKKDCKVELHRTYTLNEIGMISVNADKNAKDNKNRCLSDRIEDRPTMSIEDPAFKELHPSTGNNGNGDIRFAHHDVVLDRYGYCGTKSSMSRR